MANSVIMTYQDVVDQKLILPRKNKYTMRDFNELHKNFDAITARFIIICSAATYKVPISDIIWNEKKFLFMADG